MTDGGIVDRILRQADGCVDVFENLSSTGADAASTRPPGLDLGNFKMEMEMVLQSCFSIRQRLDIKYPSYRDLTRPIQLFVSLLCHGIATLQHAWESQSLESHSTEILIHTFLSVAHFPSPDNESLEELLAFAKQKLSTSSPKLYTELLFQMASMKCTRDNGSFSVNLNAQILREVAEAHMDHRSFLEKRQNECDAKYVTKTISFEGLTDQEVDRREMTLSCPTFQHDWKDLAVGVDLALDGDSVAVEGELQPHAPASSNMTAVDSSCSDTTTPSNPFALEFAAQFLTLQWRLHFNDVFVPSVASRMSDAGSFIRDLFRQSKWPHSTQSDAMLAEFYAFTCRERLAPFDVAVSDSNSAEYSQSTPASSFASQNSCDSIDVVHSGNISVHFASSSRTLQCASLSTTHGFYHAKNHVETQRAHSPLFTMAEKVEANLLQWPEHPVLQQLLVIIQRVQSFPLSSPIPRFLMGLEILLEKVEEWEAVSAKEYSLIKPRADVIHLIMEWRKLELTCWSDMISIESTRCLENAMALWNELFLMTTATPEWIFAIPKDSRQDSANLDARVEPPIMSPSSTLLSQDGVDRTRHVAPPESEPASNYWKTMVETLNRFVIGGKSGDFAFRLQLLTLLHAHVTRTIFASAESAHQTDHSAAIQTFREKTQLLLVNLHSYHVQFLPFVASFVARKLGPIEKEIKEFVRLSKWKDANPTSLRLNAEKSRARLQKFRRKYREECLLVPLVDVVQQFHNFIDNLRFHHDAAESVAAISAHPRPVVHSSVKAWKSPKLDAAVQPPTLDTLNAHESPMTPERILLLDDLTAVERLGGAEKLLARVAKIKNHHVENSLSTLCRSPQLLEFITELQETLEDFQNDNDALLKLDVNETSTKSAIKNSTRLKRARLGDLLKYLRWLGVSHRHEHLHQRHRDHTHLLDIKNDLSFLPALPPPLQREFEQCDARFFQTLARMERMRVTARTPNSRLTMDEARKCFGFSEHLQHLVEEERAALQHLASSLHQSHKFIQLLDARSPSSSLHPPAAFDSLPQGPPSFVGAPEKAPATALVQASNLLQNMATDLASTSTEMAKIREIAHPLSASSSNFLGALASQLELLQRSVTALTVSTIELPQNLQCSGIIGLLSEGEFDGLAELTRQLATFLLTSPAPLDSSPSNRNCTSHFAVQRTVAFLKSKVLHWNQQMERCTRVRCDLASVHAQILEPFLLTLQDFHRMSTQLFSATSDSVTSNGASAQDPFDLGHHHFLQYQARFRALISVLRLDAIHALLRNGTAHPPTDPPTPSATLIRWVLTESYELGVKCLAALLQHHSHLTRLHRQLCFTFTKLLMVCCLHC